MSEQERRIGCYDNSCMFSILRPKGGVGTNGGCRCFENLVTWNETNKRWNRDEVREVRQLTMMLVQRLRQAEKERDELKEQLRESQDLDSLDFLYDYNEKVSACKQYGLCVSKSFEPDIIQQSKCDRCSICPRRNK